ncbi:DMT family transporter [Candidatus Pelagibacter ubique]|nr:DMT family transporter [Candidatus Pelagibacter ubique]
MGFICSYFTGNYSFYLVHNGAKKLGASITGFTLYIFTVYSAIYGVLFFNEQLEYYHYIGTALVFGGVYIVKRKV